MKHCCYIILAFAMCIAGAQAQDEDVLRPNGKSGSSDSRGDDSRQSTRFIIGPELGLNMNFFSSSFNSGVPLSEGNVFNSGFGISPFFGVYFEAGLNRNFGIGARFLYDMKSVTGSIDSAVGDCGTVPGVTRTYSVDFTQKVTYFTMNPLVRWSPVEELILHFGPVIQVAVSDVNRDFTRTLYEDQICLFPDSEGNPVRAGTVSDVDSVATGTRFGVDIGIGYRLALAPSIALVPRIGYQLMFTPVAPDVAGFDQSQSLSTGVAPFTHTDRKLSSLQASIALWFTL